MLSQEIHVAYHGSGAVDKFRDITDLPEEINCHFATICETFPPLYSTLLPSYLLNPSSPPTIQFGNIKATSTSHYLISFLEFIHVTLNKQNTSLAAAFVDFKKAFDLVDNTVVINKAISLGLPPHLIVWLVNFFTGRQQAVHYQGSMSSFQQLTCGVPQDTKMDPLCFLLLINDIHQHPSSLEVREQLHCGCANRQ
ncbi:RNA-directed DNA polymerase from mobile element jockey [Portunus trituberculatus]|uniref:RNA-directed DNA polymerase from mobile element jockey n=1 Tax=Portunus trituberculatus TaxID=210409 RepID=A0A5B7DAB5_PORTR|nr:RNA-directed DNA polymerase from mobile element jockey [Portunus trituberculatus]